MRNDSDAGGGQLVTNLAGSYFNVIADLSSDIVVLRRCGRSKDLSLYLPPALALVQEKVSTGYKILCRAWLGATGEVTRNVSY